MRKTYGPLNLNLVIFLPLLLLPARLGHFVAQAVSPLRFDGDVFAHGVDGCGALVFEVAVEGLDVGGGLVGAGEEGGELVWGYDGAEVGGEEEVVCEDLGFGWGRHFFSGGGTGVGGGGRERIDSKERCDDPC